MTAPFAPPIARPVLFVLFAMGVMAIAAPFARREDWLGWVAFLAMAVCTLGVWGLLIMGLARAFLESRRKRAESEEPPE